MLSVAILSAGGDGAHLGARLVLLHHVLRHTGRRARPGGSPSLAQRVWPRHRMCPAIAYPFHTWLSGRDELEPMATRADAIELAARSAGWNGFN